MLLKEVVRKLGLKPRSDGPADTEVTSGYASDLLSDVLAHAGRDAIWVTNQKHHNIIGVAVMLNLAGVVIAGGIEPDESTVEKAGVEGIPLYTTDMSMFEVVGRLYESGIKGS